MGSPISNGRIKTDVAILGGGPGGAAAAMFLIKQGIKPLIIEAEEFPRYHIGESLTGEGALVLTRLGLRDEMMKRSYPVKKGVKVYGSSGKNSWFVAVGYRSPEWKLEPGIAWQVRRSDFDRMMLDEAVARGATLLHAKAKRPILGDDGSVRGLEVETREGTAARVESEFLLDVSGQATFLANQKVTGPKYLGSYDKQIAIFSQIVGAVRDSGGSRENDPDNTVIFYQQKYHWGWFIPLDDQVVSVGVVCPAAYFRERNESKKAFLTRELQELNPTMKKHIPEVKMVEDVHVIPNYSYQVRRFTGKGYACVGDAHRFMDPIFSFGVTVSMREAEIIAPLVREYLDGNRRDNDRPFEDYEKKCEEAIDVLEDAIDMFWEYPFGFAKCVYHDFPELITDVLAGRIYDRQPSPGILTFRKALKRDRSYDPNSFSIPVGSRYHPERAQIWEAASQVESTESWMGPR